MRRPRDPRTAPARADRPRRRVAARPPAAVPPSALPRSMPSSTSVSWLSLTIGPTSVSGSVGSPTTPRSILASKSLPEVVVDRALDVDAAGGGALLAGRPEGAGVDELRRTIEVGVRHDDRGVVAAELELDALAERGCLAAHLLADRHRAGERDRPHVRVRHQRRADGRAAADDDVEARRPGSRPRRSTRPGGARSAALPARAS